MTYFENHESLKSETEFMFVSEELKQKVVEYFVQDPEVEDLSEFGFEGDDDGFDDYEDDGWDICEPGTEGYDDGDEDEDSRV